MGNITNVLLNKDGSIDIKCDQRMKNSPIGIVLSRTTTINLGI